MYIITEEEKRAMAALDIAISHVLLLDKFRTAPPGRVIEMLPENIRKDLALLKSNYIAGIRSKYCYMGPPI